MRNDPSNSASLNICFEVHAFDGNKVFCDRGGRGAVSPPSSGEGLGLVGNAGFDALLRWEGCEQVD